MVEVTKQADAGTKPADVTKPTEVTKQADAGTKPATSPTTDTATKVAKGKQVMVALNNVNHGAIVLSNGTEVVLPQVFDVDSAKWKAISDEVAEFCEHHPSLFITEVKAD